MTKEQLRADMRAKRRALTAENVSEMSAQIRKQLMSLDIIKNAETVCIFLSAFKEPDTFEIVRALTAASKRVVVPITDEENVTLSLGYIDSTDDLTRGAYGIYEPSVIRPANSDELDVIVVPALAFDRHGNRLGFGMGYYDRLLASNGCPKIGLCYDFQLLDEIPAEPHDIAMNFIITEKEIAEVI